MELIKGSKIGFTISRRRLLISYFYIITFLNRQLVVKAFFLEIIRSHIFQIRVYVSGRYNHISRYQRRHRVKRGKQNYTFQIKSLETENRFGTILLSIEGIINYRSGKNNKLTGESIKIIAAYLRVAQIHISNIEKDLRNYSS